MVQPRTFRRMDLIEVRRQLVHARNRHSNNSLIVRRINGLLCRIITWRKRSTLAKVSESAKLFKLCYEIHRRVSLT